MILHLIRASIGYRLVTLDLIMPQQQAEQIAQAALQAPINNLIVVGILIALIIVLGGGFLIWKFMPIILKQIQQLIDNNIQLAKIADQNASAARLAQQTADDNRVQLTEQTGLLREQKGLLGEQNVLLTDFKNFQKLNNDQVATATAKIDNLESGVSQNTETITALKSEITARLEGIEAKLAELINKQPDCPDLRPDFEAFRAELLSRLQPVNAVSSNVLPNATMHADDGGAGSESEKTA